MLVSEPVFSRQKSTVVFFFASLDEFNIAMGGQEAGFWGETAGVVGNDL